MLCIWLGVRRILFGSWWWVKKKWKTTHLKRREKTHPPRKNKSIARFLSRDTKKLGKKWKPQRSHFFSFSKWLCLWYAPPPNANTFLNNLFPPCTYLCIYFDKNWMKNTKCSSESLAGKLFHWKLYLVMCDANPEWNERKTNASNATNWQIDKIRAKQISNEEEIKWRKRNGCTLITFGLLTV